MLEWGKVKVMKKKEKNDNKNDVTVKQGANPVIDLFALTQAKTGS